MELNASFELEMASFKLQDLLDCLLHDKNNCNIYLYFQKAL